MKKLLLLVIFCFIACDDTTSVTPKFVKVKAVTISEFPATDNGIGWDSLDGPDLYFSILHNGNEIYASKSDVRCNYTGTEATWTITEKLHLDKPLDKYVLMLYDQDTLDLDDLMGERTFTPFNNQSGYPSSIYLNCPGCSTRWVLDLEFIH
jgi:hypothetical protein